MRSSGLPSMLLILSFLGFSALRFSQFLPPLPSHRSPPPSPLSTPILTPHCTQVVRMNTYNTSGVKKVAPELLQAALKAPIVTFGSPSAVKAWVALVGLAVSPSGGELIILPVRGTVTLPSTLYRRLQCKYAIGGLMS